MNDFPYWKQQTTGSALYPDIEWAKPEQRSMAGRLGIIGGNKLGFAGVGEAYTVACAAGVGEVRVLLPDVLRKTIPAAITDAIFGASNPSGSLARVATTEMHTLGQWASGILLIGDAGRNAETAIAYEDFIRDYTGPLTITRDAVDLVKNSSQLLFERPNTQLVVSFAQLQKLFQAVYYTKILTFSMQLSNFVEAIHKFTLSYPVTITVLHKDHLLVANNGMVTSTAWENPMAIWRGNTASKAAVYQMWHPGRQLEAITTSLLA